MYFKEQKSLEEKSESLTFNTVDSFLQFKYDLTDPQNLKLFERWLRKLVDIKEIMVEVPQEIEVLRSSHLGVLYVSPSLAKDKFLDEFFKICYLRNAVFGVPFMWLNYDRLKIRNSAENEIFACKKRPNCSVGTGGSLPSALLLPRRLQELRRRKKGARLGSSHRRFQFGGIRSFFPVSFDFGVDSRHLQRVLFEGFRVHHFALRRTSLRRSERHFHSFCHSEQKQNEVHFRVQ